MVVVVSRGRMTLFSATGRGLQVSTAPQSISVGLAANRQRRSELRLRPDRDGGNGAVGARELIGRCVRAKAGRSGIIISDVANDEKGADVGH